MNNTYTLKSLIELMLGKIRLIIVLTVLVGAAAFGVAKFMMPLEYESHTSMYVKNNTTTVEDGINISDLNASKSLVSTYIAILQDDAVMGNVGNSLLHKYGKERISEIFSVKMENGNSVVSASSLRSCLTMAAVGETEVLKITAVTTDPEISAALCNTIADIAPEILIRVVGAGSVEIIGEAKVNPSPVAPSVPKYTLLGLMAGFMIAVLIILVIDFFDNTVKETDLLADKYEKAIIGEIHSFHSDKDEKKGKKKKDDERSHSLLTDSNIPFQISESYKAMRTNLTFTLSTSDKKVFAVSSPNPGDGKSTTAANLAIALAQLDHKVLLIDADMRKPVQHRIFKVKNQVGLSSVLAKMSTADKAVKKNVVQNLDVMSSGPKPPNPSELLASEQMEKLISELSAQYDYVIVDTPPVNVVSDAFGLSSSIAGIVLVLRYGTTTFEETDDAMKKIELSDVNMLGFVMNDIKRKHGSGYYYRSKSKYYDYNYGYGDTSKEKNAGSSETEADE